MEQNYDYKEQMQAMLDGFDEWCDRREHSRTNIIRSAFLVLAVSASVAATAQLMPERNDTYVSGNLSCCVDEACTRVDMMLAGRP